MRSDLVYVAASAELEIFDVSVPATPVRVGGIATPGMARDVFLRGSMAYVADNDAGVLFVDVGVPESPVAVGTFGSSSYTHRAVVVGDRVLISDANFLIIPDQCPTVPTGVPSDLVQAVNLRGVPNPFNPTSTVQFHLPHRDQVRLDVYDIAGRSVGMLMEGTLEAGDHQVDFRASGLASGVYVCRLVTSRGEVSQKLTLLK